MKLISNISLMILCMVLASPASARELLIASAVSAANVVGENAAAAAIAAASVVGGDEPTPSPSPEPSVQSDIVTRVTAIAAAVAGGSSTSSPTPTPSSSPTSSPVRSPTPKPSPSPVPTTGSFDFGGLLAGLGLGGLSLGGGSSPSPSASSPAPTGSPAPSPSIFDGFLSGFFGLGSPSPSPSPKASPGPSPDVSPSPTASPEASPSASPSPSPSPSPSASPSASPSPSPTTTPSPTPSPTTATCAGTLRTLTSADQSQFVTEHNADRACHSAGALSWNSALATAQEEFLCGCNFAHDYPALSAVGQGENLYAAFPVKTNTEAIQEAIDGWYNEINDYDFSNPGFSAATGHFTQLVWTDTTELGCGVIVCPGTTSPFSGSSDEWIMVGCRYTPPGNFEGQYGDKVLPSTC